MTARTVADVGWILLVVGVGLAAWAIRRRPRGWKRMTWKAVAATPGTHEGVVVAGLALVILGVVVVEVAKMVRLS